MVSPLESMDAELNAQSYALLGDTIAYARQGAVAAPLAAIVDHAGENERLGGIRVAKDEAAIEVAKTDVPEPDAGDRITLPKRPGETFAPKTHVSDESGMNWLIVLKVVAE